MLIVLDGLGIGALPDAKRYGDEGTHTLRSIVSASGRLHVPNLTRLGLAKIAGVAQLPDDSNVVGAFGRMAEQSAGKDSTTGHWEIAGVVTQTAFPLYPNGFPPEVLDRFLAVTGCKGVLGNKPASGTEIIRELGDEHVRSGYPIVYTSGDSVFQIAAHEDVLSLEALYGICTKAREHVLVGAHRVGRVIARPFVGTSGSYVRTPSRRDFALEPPAKTVLDILHDAGVETVGIGKIDDLYTGRGLKRKIHTTSNADGVRKILENASAMKNGFLMANLVDFDMLYGHRQDAAGFAKALEAFDDVLPQILATLNGDDLLILTADHGNDPGDRSTDHSREYVPLLCATAGGSRAVDLGTRKSFADVGKTLAEFFGVDAGAISGESFLSQIV